ncbi:MAG TPA: nucleotide exchange factor GrpE [Anaerolineae bacterium]
MSVSEEIVVEEQKNLDDIEAAEVVTAEAPETTQVEEGQEGTSEEALAEEPLSLEEQLAAAQAEAAKNLDGWMRAQAEFANARKRLERQRAEAYLNATADLAARLLPVLDDFERALENVPEEIADHSWIEGILLVQRKLAAVLESYNVTPIAAVGQPFDPNLHEALSQEASDEFESGVVTRELQKGYKIGDRVLRPSLVYVAE